MNPIIINKNLLLPIVFYLSVLFCLAQNTFISVDTISYKIYPEVNETRPDLPSPFITKKDEIYVIAVFSTYPVHCQYPLTVALKSGTCNWS